MMFELIEDTVKLGLIVFCFHAALGMYARLRQPAWSTLLERRRVAVLWTLVLAVLAIKVTEDVLGGESGPIDRAILVFIHRHVPGAAMWLFEAITLTGSATALVPLVSMATIALLYRKRRTDAFVLGASAVSGAAVVYVVKTFVGRARPELWPAHWYSGSSFPSGHTLVVAAVATASALALARQWPASRGWALGVALAWTLLVAFSRLVLGVHWPTDVLAAACIGVTLPLAISLAVAFNRDR
jgi:undecaprenyl-diphosphatase